MPAPNFDLERLLAPVAAGAFFRESWERQPRLIARTAGLLSRAARAGRRGTHHRVHAPEIRGCRGLRREAARAATYVQGWLAERPAQDGTRFPGIAELQRVYEQGKTIILMTMQRRWPPVASLCRHLEAFFECPVHANMYLTPEGAQGFDAHFDPHEVFVLQLEGFKTWRLYGCARPLPLMDERFELARHQLGEAREVRLEPGDLLYIPRGFVHEAFTSECASLHLTVGINVYRWADLLQEALMRAARRDERFRASLPPGALTDPRQRSALEDHFRGLLDALARQADAGAALRALGDQFFGQLQVLPGAHFSPPESGAALDLDTPLQRSAEAICRVLQDGDWVVIAYPGGQIGGPSKIAPALHYIAQAEGFSARDLPGELGDEGKLVLVRRLLRERLLTIASGPVGNAEK